MIQVRALFRQGTWNRTQDGTEMHIKFEAENLNLTEHLEGLHTNGKAIINVYEINRI